jgi:hypothetical protein
MKRELIEDFLNLPGIVGIALIDGQSHAYAYGLPTICSGEHPYGFVQGIQQIIETTPSNLESFSFHAAQHQVWLHKVDRGMTLLVITAPPLSAHYAKSIAQLTRFMKTDFEAVAQGLMAVASPVVAFEAGVPIRIKTVAEKNWLAMPEAHQNGAPEDMEATLDEILIAMNRLSAFTTEYLGKFIVANHWRTHRPAENWLEQFQIATNGVISLQEGTRLCQTDILSPQQLTWIQQWVAGFSQRCARIIRDYQPLVHEHALNERQWQLLFKTP